MNKTKSKKVPISKEKCKGCLKKSAKIKKLEGENRILQLALLSEDNEETQARLTRQRAITSYKTDYANLLKMTKE